MMGAGGATALQHSRSCSRSLGKHLDLAFLVLAVRGHWWREDPIGGLAFPTVLKCFPLWWRFDK